MEKECWIIYLSFFCFCICRLTESQIPNQEINLCCEFWLFYQDTADGARGCFDCRCGSFSSFKELVFYVLSCIMHRVTRAGLDHDSVSTATLLCNCAVFVVTVGPCALEYTKMKTADHFWTDPSADELVQRHRIHGGHCRQDSPTKRPTLCVSTATGNTAD